MKEEWTAYSTTVSLNKLRQIYILKAINNGLKTKAKVYMKYVWQELYDMMEILQPYIAKKDLQLIQEIGESGITDYNFKVKFRKICVGIISSYLNKIQINYQKIDNIKKVFNLTDEEIKCILYLYFLYQDNYPLPNIFEAYSNMQVLRLEFGARLNKVLEALKDKGIIYYHLRVNNMLKCLLLNDQIVTEYDIKNMVSGTKPKVNLTKKDFFFMEDSLLKCSEIINKAIKENKKGVNILLYGPPGTGKTEFSKLLAKNMYMVETRSNFGEDFQEGNRQTRLGHLLLLCNLFRQSKAAVIFDEAEDIFNRGYGENGDAYKGYTNHLLENNNLPVIWISNEIDCVDSAFKRRMTYAVEFKELSKDIRLKIWKKLLKQTNLKIKPNLVKELNESYNVATSIVSNAIKTTDMINGNEKDIRDIIDAVSKITYGINIRKEKDSKLTGYDLSLVNSEIDLTSFTDRIVRSKRLDFSLCFYGEPGTGKSLYARYLADRLGIPVIQKRVSDLISMYVGESEKNIANAFKEAEQEKAMLIFDEADSFLSSRQNAIRSWEISQVNEMLTQMENHKYPFVCTTNFMDILDEASLRRFTFKIKFNFMSEKQFNSAIKSFFNIDAPYIKGLTVGDFANVKKKVQFLCGNKKEIIKMLQDEVKLKKSSELKNQIGFNK